MDYGLAHPVAPTQDRSLVNGSAKSSDINRSVRWLVREAGWEIIVFCFRMCKEILDDKTLNVEEMMNSLNSRPVPAPAPITVTPEPGSTVVTANGGQQRLPEKVRSFNHKTRSSTLLHKLCQCHFKSTIPRLGWMEPQDTFFRLH